MKKVLVIILATITNLAAYGNASQVTASDKLMTEVKMGTVFTQVTSERRCPKSIRPVESQVLPESAKAGDRGIYLQPDDGGFTHDGNQIVFRPGLKLGKTHVLKRSVSFPAGVAYSVSRQYEDSNLLVTGYSARIASLAMVVASDYKLDYDSNAGIIKYHFSGNGVSDVDCTFKK